MGELGKLFYTISLKGMEEFKQDVEDTEGQTEQSSNKMVEAFKKIGAAVATYLSVTKVIEFGKACVDAAATVSAETSAFEQIMGDYSDTAQTKMNEIADATGVVATRLTPYMTSMTAKFKGLGFDIEDATTLASDGLTLASDAAAFWDKSLDESMSHLNSFINGSYEGGEAIGLFANDTQMAAYAVSQGIVASTKDWSALDEATKQATRLEYAKNMFAQSGATGQAAKEASQYANVQANLNEKWRQFKAQIGEPILQNIVLPAMQKLSGLIDKASAGFETLKVKVQNLTAWYEKNKTWVDLLAIAIGAIMTGMTAYGAVMLALEAKAKLVAAAQALMNSAMLASPITWIIAGITAVVAAIIYLWNNCEWFRNMLTGLWEWIKNGISTAVEWISTTFTNFITWISTTWQTFVTWWNTSLQAVYEFLTNLINGALEWISIKLNEFLNWIIETISGWVAWFQTTWQNLKLWFDTLLQMIYDFIMNIWNSILAFITGVMNAISNTFTTIWTAIKTKITTIITNIKTTVTNIFTSVKNTISSIWDSVKAKTSSIWDAIKSAIENPITKAKETVNSMIERIKKIMDFDWHLPHLKLPHINITGSFSLLPPSAPKFSIDWYAKGGILEAPTIFGANGNTLMAGGEAGPEAVAPISELMGYVRAAVAESNNNGTIETLLNNILDLMKDDDRMKRIILEAVNDSGLRIILDGREVGRIVKKYA